MVPSRAARVCSPPARVARHAADPTDCVQGRETRQLASEDGQALRRLHVPRPATCPRCAASSKMLLIVVPDGTDAREPQRRRTQRPAGVLGQLRSSRALDRSCAMSARRSACRGGERHELPTRSHVVRSLCARACPRRRRTARRRALSSNAFAATVLREIFAWTIRSQTAIPLLTLWRDLAARRHALT